MAIIKYEDLNDVQNIIYGDGLTLEAVTIPMINNGLNVRQLKGRPDKDGRYFDLNGNKIDSSRCWASTTSRQSMLAEPYNAFSEKARCWSSMVGDEEPFLCYSRAYFDYTIDPDTGEKVHEWVTEGVAADIKYVALDLDKHTKSILHQVIVEAAVEKDGAFEIVLEIPRADLMRDEILEIGEEFQNTKYTDFRFRFIKMPAHIKEPVLVNSAMLLREVKGTSLGGGGCKPMSFKIGDKFVQEHPDGIGRLRPAFPGDTSWRYVTNKTCDELLFEIFDGQALPKKMPLPVIKPEKTPIVNADCGGPNGKTIVTADWEVPVGVKAIFAPEMVVGSGHLVGKINSSASEVVTGASMKAVNLPDDIIIPENPVYTLEIDNINGTDKKVGRITSIVNASPNDVGAIFYLEGCVKFIVENEGKFQEGESKSKVVKKDLSYNGKVFYTAATCDVVINPAIGTGAGGKFSRKDAIKASYTNLVMGESIISKPWELFINNNPTGITAANPGDEVDLMAAIVAEEDDKGGIPDQEKGYVITFRVVDDNPKANGASCISKSVTVTIEQKPPYMAATCDVALDPPTGTGAEGKFSRKDAIKASFDNVVLGESIISKPWELFVNGKATGVTAAAGVKVDVMAAIKAFGAIPDEETVFSVDFRVTDDNGELCVSKTVSVVIEQKPPYMAATCDVTLNPATGTGAEGKFSRKDAVKASFDNVVLNDSQITEQWELFVNNNGTGVKASAGDEVDVMAAIKALGAIPDVETTYTVNFKVTDDNGELCVSKTVNVVIEAKPPYAEPTLVITKDGAEVKEVTIARGETEVTGLAAKLVKNDSTVEVTDLKLSITNVTDVITGNEGTDVADQALTVADLTVADLAKPKNWKACKVATIKVAGQSPEGDVLEATVDVKVPECEMHCGIIAPVNFGGVGKTGAQALNAMTEDIIKTVAGAKVEAVGPDKVYNVMGYLLAALPNGANPSVIFADAGGVNVTNSVGANKIIEFNGVEYKCYCTKGIAPTTMIKLTVNV